ncbi:MAG: hypothetical protein HQ481_11080 [Alphaproteobacteria bacterium]|nr:hypothetical protein [Alphaproteobacteria bacterium]
MSFGDRHLDLLLSRLFHDLIGPVSAARNGLELVTDFGDDDVGTEAMELVGLSVEQAIARLTFFRMAFGGAGSSAGHGFAAALPIARAYLASRKLEPAFDIPAGAPTAPTGLIKVMLALMVVAADSLPRGGRVAVSLVPGAVEISGEGDRAELAITTREALKGVGDPEDERAILAFAVARSAKRFGVTVTVADGAMARFRVSHPDLP